MVNWRTGFIERELDCLPDDPRPETPRSNARRCDTTTTSHLAASGAGAGGADDFFGPAIGQCCDMRASAWSEN